MLTTAHAGPHAARPCHRCGFSFPVLPGEFKSVILTAMHNHKCNGPEAGNWQAVGEAIIARIADLDSDRSGALLGAAWRQPDDKAACDEAWLRPRGRSHAPRPKPASHG